MRGAGRKIIRRFYTIVFILFAIAALVCGLDKAGSNTSSRYFASEKNIISADDIFSWAEMIGNAVK